MNTDKTWLINRVHDLCGTTLKRFILLLSEGTTLEKFKEFYDSFEGRLTIEVGGVTNSAGLERVYSKYFFDAKNIELISIEYDDEDDGIAIVESHIDDDEVTSVIRISETSNVTHIDHTISRRRRPIPKIVVLARG